MRSTKALSFGSWPNTSERAAAAEGFRSVELMATLAGAELYRACGYEAVDNLRLSLMPALIDLGDSVHRPLAIGIDSRTRDFDADHFIERLDALARRPDIDLRLCKFIWLGTHQKFDDAFTFIFEQTQHGWMWAHAYQFDENFQKAVFPLFMIGCGVLAGTKNEYQPGTLNFGTPDSANVGMSGNTGRRTLPDTASSLSLPALRLPLCAAKPSKIASRRPATPIAREATPTTWRCLSAAPMR